MSGPPARDQKFAPSQLVGLPPDVTRAVFLRTQQLLLMPASRLSAITRWRSPAIAPALSGKCDP
jgi:hypothetical protein